MLSQLLSSSGIVQLSIVAQPVEQLTGLVCQIWRPVWALEHGRISPPYLLSNCRKKRLYQASFVLLCFVLFPFSGLCLVFVVSVLDLSSVLYFPACTDVNVTVQPNCADVPLRICSLTHSLPQLLSGEQYRVQLSLVAQSFEQLTGLVCQILTCKKPSPI